MLFDVPPVLAKHNVRNRGFVNAELIGQFLLQIGAGLNALSNFSHLVRRKFGNAMTFAKGVTPFVSRIPVVIKSGAKEQMIRTNAQPVVTGVAHEHPFRDNTICPLVTEPVCVQHSLAGVRLHHEQAVASAILAASPQPARIRLSDLRPKAALGVGRTPKVGAFTRAMAVWLRVMVGKDTPALRANAFKVGARTGTLGAHRKLLSSGAMLRDVTASPGLSCTSNYTAWGCANG